MLSHRLASDLPAGGHGSGFDLRALGYRPFGCVRCRLRRIDPVLTSNPVAYGLPTTDDPILIDLCTSVVSNFAITGFQKEDKRLPGPWLLDNQGNPTDDPQALRTDPPGTIMPVGGADFGYKGFALGLMVEAFTLALSGYGRSEGHKSFGEGVFVQVINPDFFAGRSAFEGEMARLADRCRESRVTLGKDGVRLPGQRAQARAREADQSGVPVPGAIVTLLRPWIDAKRKPPDLPIHPLMVPEPWSTTPNIRPETERLDQRQHKRQGKPMLQDLEGKRALVTGSSSGIAEAVAKALAMQGVAVDAARQVAREIAIDGGRTHIVLGDVSRPNFCAQIVEEAVEALGGLDILVNNAGSIIQRVTNAEFYDDVFTQVYALNVRSVLAVTKAAYPHLKASGAGSIINTGSVAGRMGGFAGSTVYASSKAAVHSITRNAAREFAADGIRVNKVAPGYVATPIHSATPQQTRDLIASQILMQRLGTATECAGAYVFLASASMSVYITGQIIDVNGGLLMS